MKPLPSPRLPLPLSLLLSLSLLPAVSHAAHDLVIYGGTSAGIAAAVQATRMGKSVVLIEPTRRVGGLTTGGLGQTDIGNKAAIGGIAREFYQGIKRHYDDPAAWKWQPQVLYRDSGQTRTDSGEAARWTFEPSAALRVFHDWIRTNRIGVIYNERLDRATGVTLSATTPPRIESIRMESGKTFPGRMFIDATYEGDLLAAAKITFTVGREPNARYGETLNGIQPAQARFHQLVPGISPYLKPGDPTSGLLPHINPNGPGQEGDGDHRVQAYCFRMCLTDHPDNRIPFHKPAGYVELWYELLFRNYEAGEKAVPWINSSMPNRKTDTNNRLGFSTDFIGQNYAYPTASYPERAHIIAQHRLYQQGLMWTLANHPRIPEPVRREVSRWGVCKDEFTEGNGWQEQLYIREARRMIADLVMTQHHCQGREVAPEPVGLAAYTMDSHHQQRYIDAKGHVRNEGDVEVGGFSPYPIGFRAIVPREQECANLLTPTCLSASHIAFGSIRMEPVFMVLGQSAATAAAHAIDENVPLQRIAQPKFRARLEADHQVLTWTGPTKAAATGLDPRKLPGLVIDDEQAQRTGFTTTGNLVPPFIGAGYRHDANADKGKQTARFPINAPSSGKYEVRIAYNSHANRATNVPLTLTHAAGQAKLHVNQRQPAIIDRLLQPIGAFEFLAGTTYHLEISNAGTDGHVMIDAVQLVPAP